MLPDGQIVEQAVAAARSNTPDADIAKKVKSAAEMMVYTPHRVTLARARARPYASGFRGPTTWRPVSTGPA